ncbi:MAG: RimK family alpha-L-glutamate ligase [Gammaproteobacteria bacterium]|nr:RimK family alpha-L-glutamate ligase [Gammaproteobacteria bacterium]
MTNKAAMQAVDSESSGDIPLQGMAALMHALISGGDLGALGSGLIARVQRNPADANALMDLATMLQLAGKPDLALNAQQQALALSRLYRIVPADGRVGIRVLALMAPGDLMSNTPLEFLVHGSDIQLEMLYLSPLLSLPAAVPDHDVLFVAIGESEHNQTLLRALTDALKEWPRPVINRPELIARLSRDQVSVLLNGIPGLVIPASVRVGRAALQQLACGAGGIGAMLGDGGFPVIIRPTDSHAGRGLAKIDDPGAIPAYLADLPQDHFCIARFVDYRGRDGLFRKFRIALIQGQPFACHMAVSDSWMIHYINAGMMESGEKRLEEERFMTGFDDGFARRHAAALHAIDERIGLDYLVIDCAETADGQLLVFEIDSSAVVHSMDPVDIFPYKQAPMRKVFQAFRGMLGQAAAHAAHSDSRGAA